MSALKVITIIKTILILVHCHCCSYSLPIENSQRPPNCYYFGPGITIPGADYRRDYGLSRIDCAEICKFDPCCMAFEWKKKLGVCTLKSRSLNGTITKVEGEVFFGLCLDHDDDERDRFWDHELVGHSIASSPKIDRIKCEDFCRSLKYGDEYRKKQRKNTSDKSDEVKTHMNIREHQKKESHNAAKNLVGLGGKTKNRINIYNWHNEDSMNTDEKTGRCECISVLQSIKLSFGSFAGFVI